MRAADGIRNIILEEGGERILLLTRELERSTRWEARQGRLLRRTPEPAPSAIRLSAQRSHRANKVGCGHSEIAGFVYSFDEAISQSAWAGISSYIAQVWDLQSAGQCVPLALQSPALPSVDCTAQVFVAPTERRQGLGELLLSAALASALSRGTVASHLFLCSRNG